MKNRNSSAKSKRYKTKLLHSLNEKSCFFFTGSGISIESQISSVKDVLGHTCNKFLNEYNNDFSYVPTKVSRKDYICDNVQPELFYSVLLDYSRNDCVLEMWNCLKQDHFTESYCPQPNIIHYFIVVYSYLANVPVFTMNYDKMLENACEKLNIPFCVCVDDLPSESLQNQVIICKLHGNLKEGSGNRVTKNDIKTTMPDIARKNGEWLRYINRFMKTHDMCILGYSGRDIDYFPFLREYAKTTHRKTFWTIGNPKESKMDKLTEENASLLVNVNKINGYPSCMKDELIEVLESLDINNSFVPIVHQLIRQISVSKEAKNLFLKEIEQNIDPSDVSCDGDIFWMLLMKATGQNKDLGKVINELLEQIAKNKKSLTEIEMIALLEARIVLAREQADFSAYRQLSKKLFKVAKKSKLPDAQRCQYLETARVQYISSLQMCVPSALALKVPLCKQRYGLLLLVRLGFAFLNYRFKRNKELYNQNEMLAQECEIRSLAIDCKVPFLKKLSKKRLENLKERAEDIGNYNTVIGTNKYLSKLDKTEEYEQNVKFSGSIVGDLSALSIINRDKNPDVALKDARENDNTLNIVKAIFRKKDLINQDLIKKRTTNLTISNEEKKLLLESIMIITPKSLRQTLLDIGKREKLFEVYKGYH